MNLSFFKKITIALLLSAFAQVTTLAQDTTRPPKPAQAAVSADSFSKLSVAVARLEKSVTELDKKIAKKEEQKAECTGQMNGFSAKWVLVFLPVFLLLLLGWFFVSLVLKGKVKLDETLSTGGGTTQTVETVDAGGTTTRRVIEPPAKPVGSTSRLIAFLTGIVALLIAICLVTYYAYFMVAECQGEQDFAHLWTILAGLGIGIIPYGLNVIRGNKKEQ